MARKLCPSAEPVDDARLLGVVGEDGLVEYLPLAPPAPELLIERLRRQPEERGRIRFAAPCLEHGCARWNGARCALEDLVPRGLRADATLPACGIRAECRWFDQDGAAACRLCPTVTRTARAAALLPEAPPR